MFRVLKVWAICGIALTAIANAAPSADQAAPREWTDASGIHSVRATLLRVEGDKLWLRRSDGQLTTTTLANLSEHDRHYVASRSDQPSTDSNSSSGPAAAIESVSDYVQSLQQLPGWLEPSQPGADRSLVPSALVYVRVSREFLEDYVERSVNRHKPVRDCVLGTRIVGESETSGKTVLTLLPSNDQLRARIAFEGTVLARTRGYNGPVILHNISDSTFRAAKLIAMDDSGLRVSPSTAVAPTRLRTTSIDTNLPWLRGRIATRIAWRRTASSHDRAEAITAEHTADDIRSDLDTRINRSMAKVQKVFGSKIPDLETGTSPMRTDVRFHCTADCMEIAIIREHASEEERKLRPPGALKNSDVAVRVHRTLFTSAIEDPQLLQDLTPLFGKLLQARAGQNGGGDAGDTAGAKNADAKWAVDSEWLSLDFKDSSR